MHSAWYSLHPRLGVEQLLMQICSCTLSVRWSHIARHTFAEPRSESFSHTRVLTVPLRPLKSWALAQKHEISKCSRLCRLRIGWYITAAVMFFQIIMIFLYLSNLTFLFQLHVLSLDLIKSVHVGGARSRSDRPRVFETRKWSSPVSYF